MKLMSEAEDQETINFAKELIERTNNRSTACFAWKISSYNWVSREDVPSTTLELRFCQSGSQSGAPRRQHVNIAPNGAEWHFVLSTAGPGSTPGMYSTGRVRGETTGDIVRYLDSVFNRFSSVVFIFQPIFDITVQPGINVVGVMSLLNWTLVEKSQAFMSDRFFDEVRFQIMHLRSCILAEILLILDSKQFHPWPEIRNRLSALNCSPGHRGA